MARAKKIPFLFNFKRIFLAHKSLVHLLIQLSLLILDLTFIVTLYILQRAPSEVVDCSDRKCYL
jgi:hypothetical protein